MRYYLVLKYLVIVVNSAISKYVMDKSHTCDNVQCALLAFNS